MLYLLSLFLILLQYDKNYIGFSNGILNISTCEFFEEVLNITVYKYIDKEFNHSMETPLFDSILNYQFSKTKNKIPKTTCFKVVFLWLI